MFSDKIKEQLSKPLLEAHVKTRPDSGYHYVEGWHIKDTANKIFGYDGWSYQTVYNKQVASYESSNKKNVVCYEAKVRVLVGDIVRDGTGFGKGIAKDIGDCIEKACKEAETDALKRAFASFGGQFGLSLYAKEDKKIAPYEAISEAQEEQLQMLIETRNVDAKKLFDFYKISSLSELPENRFVQLKSHLLTKGRKNENS